ncbi:reverse transcriptase domain-containing protein [Tanacetum coccineum]
MLSGLASKVQNMEGQMVGPDCNPLKPYDGMIFVAIETVTAMPTNTDKENFQALDTGKPNNAKAEIQIQKSSVLEAHAIFGFILYVYFGGKRVAFSVVEYYVKNVWVLGNGLWFIRLIPIILKKWMPTSNLLNEDLNLVPIWVKLHDILIVVFTPDGLSAMATKLGNPIMLDLYTSSICLQSWGRMDYARALIDVMVDQELKEEMVIAIPNVEDDGEVFHSVRVDYEWKPPRCGMCMIFGHDDKLCLKWVVGIPMNDGFRTDKVASGSMATISGTKEEGQSVIHIVDKINVLEKQILECKLVLVDDDGKPLEKVDYPGDLGNDDEVEPVDNEMTTFLALKWTGIWSVMVVGPMEGG